MAGLAAAHKLGRCAALALRFPFSPILITNSLYGLVVGILPSIQRKSDALEIQNHLTHRCLDCDWHGL